MLDELADRWRVDAMTLRRRGATAQAELLESCAAELEAANAEAEIRFAAAIDRVSLEERAPL